MYGWEGEIKLPEAHGRLLEPLIVVAPMVCPQLQITYAIYGALASHKEQSLLPGARPKFRSSPLSVECDVVLQDLVDDAEGERYVLLFLSSMIVLVDCLSVFTIKIILYNMSNLTYIYRLVSWIHSFFFYFFFLFTKTQVRNWTRY